jgi:hypothetical protein
MLGSSVFLGKVLRFLFMKVRSKLSTFGVEGLGFLECLKELFVIQQFSLKVIKGNSHISVAIAESGDKGMIRRIEPPMT